jgi:hypothetical protein
MPVGYLTPRDRNFDEMPVWENYEQIARQAVTHIKEHQIVYLTGGSFGFLMSTFLPRDIHYTLVVNSIDLANRLGLSPLMVMQNLYVVKGKPSWSGSFCAAAINGSGRFTPLEYIFTGEPGTPSHGCYAKATRRSNGSACVSDTVTMQMAQREGWLNKPGSKWQTMPVQMMMYRAAAFFARAHCSDLLLGMPTYEEVQDVKGYEEEGKQTVVTLENKEGS